jgi:MscS family membrane protein
MMPNENIITSSIANFSVRESRRVDFVIGIVYSTSLDKVKEGVEIIKNLLQKYLADQKITEDIRVTFDMFNAFSLDIKVSYFSLEKTLQEFLTQKETINLEIKDLFEKSGIEMAFPTQEMIIKNETIPTPVKKKK